MVNRATLPSDKLIADNTLYMQVVLGVSLVVTVFYQWFGVDFWLVSGPALSILATAMSILLAVRLWAGWNRADEAAHVYGDLAAVSRDLARQATTLPVARKKTDIDATSALRTELVRRHIAWLHAVRCAVRGEDAAKDDSVAQFISEAEREGLTNTTSAAAALIHLQGEQIANATAVGWLDTSAAIAMEGTLSRLTQLHAAAARISGLPMSSALSGITGPLTWLWGIILPLATVLSFGWMTAFWCLALAMVFRIVEQSAGLLEDPFAVHAGGLPVSAMTRALEVELRSQLGETDLPAVPRGVGGFLV